MNCSGSERVRERRAGSWAGREARRAVARKNFLAGDVEFSVSVYDREPIGATWLARATCDGQPTQTKVALMVRPLARCRTSREGPHREPSGAARKFSLCGGATLLARSSQAARQADTWCTVYGVDSTTAQMIGVLPSPSEGCPKGCPPVLPRFQRGHARSPFRHMVHRV